MNKAITPSEMKKNVSENEGEELRKETFVYPAQKALKRKLSQLKKQASGNKDAYTVVLEAYTYFDIDGDGITELVVDIGTAQLARKCVAYTYDKDSGNTVNAGDLYVSDGGIILTSDGNLVTTAGRSGYYSYNKISMVNQKIVSTGMFDDHDLHDIDGEYLRAIPTSNLEPLKNAVFN